MRQRSHYFLFPYLHASLNITAVFVVMYCLSLPRTVATERRIRLWFWYAKCFGCTSVAVWDGSQFDAYNRPLSKDLSRENLLEPPTKSSTMHMSIRQRPKTHM